MEVFASVFYFGVAAVIYWIVAQKSQVELRKYSREQLLSYSNLNSIPDGFSPVENIRTSFTSKPTRFKGKGKPTEGKSHYKNDRDSKNERPNTEKQINLLEKPYQIENKENFFETQSSLSSFILKELENSVKELTNTSKPKPVAPSGYSLTSISSGNRGQARILNPNAQEYTIRRIH
jgi:hypothetical protein